MSPAILALGALVMLLALLVGIGLTVFNTAKNAKKAEDGEDSAAEQPADEQVVARPAVGGRQDARDRMLAGMRRRVAERRAAQQPAAGDEDSANESDSDDGSDGEAGAGAGNRRDARRAARREAAAAERAAQEARQSKRSAYDERRAKKDAEREAQEAAQEEEMRRAAEERAKREEAEAQKWMGMISVEAEGTDAVDDGEGGEGSLMAQFVDYIVARKTVPLEALALEFGIRTQDAIDRIHGLESMGRLTGVMDERGKYIHVSRPEMEAVAAYIRSKGRVAISELAAKSNTLIDLEQKGGAAAAGAGGRPAISFEDMLDEGAA